MRCIFYDGEWCEATPASLQRLKYKPNETEKKNRCEGTFQTCPRYEAFITYLNAIKQVKG